MHRQLSQHGQPWYMESHVHNQLKLEQQLHNKMNQQISIVFFDIIFVIQLLEINSGNHYHLNYIAAEKQRYEF